LKYNGQNRNIKPLHNHRINRRPGPDKKPMVIDFADNQVGVLRIGAKKRLRILNSL